MRVLYILRLFLTGIFATLTMDILAISAVKAGIFNLGNIQIVPGLLGRWVSNFSNGFFTYADIRTAAAVENEMAVGMISHYIIGITLTLVFIYLAKRYFSGKASLKNTLVYGVCTSVFPWLFMYPAMGFGFFGLKVIDEAFLLPFSFFTHVFFGLGIYIWVNAFKYFASKIKPQQKVA